jgi:hypothetical protein
MQGVDQREQGPRRDAGPKLAVAAGSGRDRVLAWRCGARALLLGSKTFSWPETRISLTKRCTKFLRVSREPGLVREALLSCEL